MPDRLGRAPISNGPLRLVGGYACDPPPGVRSWLLGIWSTPSKDAVPVVVLPATGAPFDEAVTAAARAAAMPEDQVRPVLEALVVAAGKRGGRRA